MASPMYRQIAEDLRAQIESGALQSGQQLRTEIEFREHYGASRNTVRDAIKLLTALGLVESKPGQGTFVVQHTDPVITDLTATPKIPTQYGETGDPAADELAGEAKERLFSSTDPQVEIQKAPADVAGQLQVEVGSQVISRHQRRYINGEPWSLQTSFYPMGFVLQGAHRLMEAGVIEVGTVKYLADTLGLEQTRYRDWITVRTPEAHEVAFFNLHQDGRTGVFEVFRTAFDKAGTPMRLTITVCPTDRNEFVINIGKETEI